jgi:hypothetical protein
MLSMRYRGANHRLCKVAHRQIGRVARNAPCKPLRDFLQQPAVAIRILERNERKVAETLGVGSGDSDVDAFKPATSPAGTVKYFACIDAVRDKLLARSHDVGDDQEQAWAEPGSADVRFRPNWIELPDPGGVN